MTKQEFETRTKISVSYTEFEAINNFYMNVECNKDEFCKLWCKMNPILVEGRREEARKAAEQEARREKAWEIYCILCNRSEIVLAVELLDAAAKKFLAENGIDEQDINCNGIPYFKTNFDIAWELNKKFSLRA